MSESKKKILVADDDPGILDVMKIMLEDIGGYEVEVTTSGHDVMNLESDFPDLILLDLWMSGINGGEVCKSLKLKAKTQNIPVVLFSANKDISEIADKVDADGYLAKPFQMKDLLSKVKQLLNK